MERNDPKGSDEPAVVAAILLDTRSRMIALNEEPVNTALSDTLPKQVLGPGVVGVSFDQLEPAAAGR